MTSVSKFDPTSGSSQKITSDINKVTTCNFLSSPALSNNVFTKEECKNIIEMGRNWEQIDATIQIKSVEVVETEKNDDYRNCKMFAPPIDETESWLWIRNKISETIDDFNDKDGWKFNLIGMAERPMMMEYLEGVGKYDWHMDLGAGQTSTRKLGFSLFLNDDYEGGEIQFKTGLYNFIPGQQETGNLLFFPSYLVHRVTLVTKGTRSVIVGWIHGNTFS